MIKLVEVDISGDESENCVDGGRGVSDCGVRHPTIIDDAASRDVSVTIFLTQFAAGPFLNLKILPPPLRFLSSVSCGNILISVLLSEAWRA